ncbi:alpha/beta fold hydrolase [Metabacillus endolithicus]|uniref:Alpha/beta fold hydrolase n=1 Tax=Metabacillus endolithicus TaxID=1535204 RepID=A0ABW5BXW1_9BACI|nr:alpha/beta hydrolase [Metabacillus endolithicus]UPG64135.1 alpha/beta hydrolase [Metabacillus endolithicus]
MPTVQLNENKIIAYDDFGQGIPVLFIHPPGMGRHVFYYQRKLSEKMRIIVPDLSGHGDSSRIKSSEVSIRHYSEELIELLNKLNLEEVVICGYSAGGVIAQNLCISYPNRVSGLILFGGYPAVINTAFQWEHKAGMYMVKHHQKFLGQLLAVSHTKNKKLRELLIQHMEKCQPSAWYKYYQVVLRSNLINDIHKINVPILLMYGTRSDLINKYLSYFKKRTNNLRVVFFKRTNHQVPTKRWKSANREISSFIATLNQQK